MDDRKNYPRTPQDRDWLDDTETHLIRVNRYDTNDLLVANQHFLLVRDTTGPDRYMVTSVAKPQPLSDYGT